MDTDPDTETLIKTEQEPFSIESYPESSNQDSEDVKPLRTDPFSIESYPESSNQDSEDDKPLRTDVSVEIVPVEPHCLNCGRDMSQNKRHNIARANVEVITVIRQWIAPQLIGEDDQICHSCFSLCLRQGNVELSEEASNGRRRQLCVTCQCSLLRRRFHTLNTPTEKMTSIRNIVEKEIAPRQLRQNEQICHSCWMKWDRKSRAPEPNSLPPGIKEPNSLPPGIKEPNFLPTEIKEPKDLPSVIYLPNITRAPDSQGCCFYPNCGSTQRKVIPRWLRVKLFTDHKFYVSPNCRLCSYHLTNHDWNDLKTYPKPIHMFTADHVEDFASFTNERFSTIDFNNIDEMEDGAVKYWIGLTKIQFKNVFETVSPKLKKIKNRQVALAAYLMKLKTGDPVVKIATLVNIPRSTLSRIMDVVRTVLQNLPDDVVPPEIGKNINNDNDTSNNDGDDE